MEYVQACEEFDALLTDVIDAGLQTRHQAFTTLQGVLLAFRCRLIPEEAIRFAQILPPLLRALFVAEWNIDANPQKPRGDRQAWLSNVKALRHHNISPDSAISDVARVLWTRLDRAQFRSCLETLPVFATSFWCEARGP